MNFCVFSPPLCGVKNRDYACRPYEAEIAETVNTVNVMKKQFIRS